MFLLSRTSSGFIPIRAERTVFSSGWIPILVPFARFGFFPEEPRVTFVMALSFPSCVLCFFFIVRESKAYLYFYVSTYLLSRRAAIIM